MAIILYDTETLTFAYVFEAIKAALLCCRIVVVAKLKMCSVPSSELKHREHFTSSLGFFNTLQAHFKDTILQDWNRVKVSRLTCCELR